MEGAKEGTAPGLEVTGAGLLPDGMDLTVVVVRAVVGVLVVLVVGARVVVVDVVVTGVVAGVRVELRPEGETQSPGYCWEQTEPGWQLEQAGPERYISPLMKFPAGP